MISLSPDKFILDACCGSRMFWFDRSHPNVVFADIRSEQHTLCDGRPLSIAPDVVADFRALPFADGSFRLVVFDPPHLSILGVNSYTAQKYGRLLPSWETDLQAGFDECMRVLGPSGTLIFKWNEFEIPLKKILALINYQPLFGHPSGKRSKTHWLTFMKGL